MYGKNTEGLKEYVDYVKANGGWLTFYEHQIGTSGYTSVEILSDLLEYIKQKDIQVKTTNEIATKSQ
jgi:hypothetical protein